MAQAAKTKAEAPFTRSNAKKCICWECHVQAESACIKANSDEMGDVMTTKAFHSGNRARALLFGRRGQL